jgi:hypothetical protein
MLPDHHLALHRDVADARSKGWPCPKASVVAGRVGLRNASDAMAFLRDLQSMRHVSGVPACHSQYTTAINVTESGWSEAADPRTFELRREQEPTLVRTTGRVIPLHWRCINCGAVTISATKPCVVCPLLAMPTETWLAAGLEPLNEGGNNLANELRLAGTT